MIKFQTDKKLFAADDDRQMKLRSNTHGCELKMIIYIHGSIPPVTENTSGLNVPFSMFNTIKLHFFFFFSSLFGKHFFNFVL